MICIPRLRMLTLRLRWRRCGGRSLRGSSGWFRRIVGNTACGDFTQQSADFDSGTRLRRDLGERTGLRRVHQCAHMAKTILTASGQIAIDQ